MALFNKESEKVLNLRPIQPSRAPSSQRQQTETGASAEGRTYVDGGSKVSGKLSFSGPAWIDGEVDGEITAKDMLTIGETAVVSAQIKATSIIVAGKVIGDISGSQAIEIRPSATVIGNLAAPVLVIQEGALFEGYCSMRSDSARDDSEVAAIPK